MGRLNLALTGGYPNPEHGDSLFDPVDKVAAWAQALESVDFTLTSRL